MRIRSTLLVVLLSVSMMVSAIGDTPSSWAKQIVDDVFSRQLLDERMQGNYQGEITRRDFAYLGVKIYEALTETRAEAGQASFPDSTDAYVLKAKNVGIVNGYQDSTFRPGRAISRQELAVLFINTLKAAKKPYNQAESKAFDDDNAIGNWAKTSVYAARQTGIVKGVGQNTFQPLGTATREQAIVMFKRVLDLYDANGNVTFDNVNYEALADFTIRDRDFKLSSYKDKPVLINFFSASNPPSLQQLSVMREIYNLYKDDYYIIGIDLLEKDTPEALLAAVNQFDINYPIVLDSGRLSETYRIQSLPTTIIMVDGDTVEWYIGTMSSGQLKKMLDTYN